MQYKVPQNIDLQDKIVGPFTLIQFVYLLIGGSLIYIIITALGVNIFSVLVASPIGFLTIALTFVKVQDQPFLKFILDIVQYLTRPKRRVWKKTGLQPELIITQTKKKETKIIDRKKVTKSELEKLAGELDTKGNQPKPEILATKPEEAQTQLRQDNQK